MESGTPEGIDLLRPSDVVEAWIERIGAEDWCSTSLRVPMRTTPLFLKFNAGKYMRRLQPLKPQLVLSSMNQTSKLFQGLKWKDL